MKCFKNASLLLGMSLLLSSAAALRLPGAALRPVQPAAAVRSSVVRMDAVEDKIDAAVKSSKVFLFMKGTKLFPQCGFSNTAVSILNSITQDYETFDVLSDEGVREGVKKYSNWPTIPQLYVGGEFIGGCDIMIEMYENGELAEEIEKAVAS